MLPLLFLLFFAVFGGVRVYALDVANLALLRVHVDYVQQIAQVHSSQANCDCQGFTRSDAIKLVKAVWEEAPLFEKPFNDPTVLLALTLALIETESKFCLTASSKVEALGLMQIHYRYWGRRLKLSRDIFFDPYWNVKIGLRILCDNLRRRNLVRALCEYHGDRRCRRLWYPSRILTDMMMHFVALTKDEESNDFLLQRVFLLLRGKDSG